MKENIRPFEKKYGWQALISTRTPVCMYVEQAFDTNWMSTIGENLDQLEKGICDYVGCKACVALSSGTAALHLAVKLAGVETGDIVIAV